MKKILFILIALTIVATAFAQDDKQTFTRKILIEQFTGADCGWCPSGADRIATASRGVEQPIAPNDTPEGRARNRRAQIALQR